MTTDILGHIEAVLAAATGYIYDGALPPADALYHATYPEALAVVRDVVDEHERYHPDAPLDACPMDACREAAAYLAKAQEYVPDDE